MASAPLSEVLRNPMNEDPACYQQETELAIILALARHVKKRTFIDVGAEKGAFASTLMSAGFSGCMFEPFPAHLPALQALVKGTDSKVFPFAIDETDHEGLLHIAVDAAGKPMDYFHSLHRDEANPLAKHKEAIPIQCHSLRTLAERGVIESATGVLKIDTEGTDLKVVNGMGSFTAEVLVCEFVTPSLYSTWESSFPEALMEAAGKRGYDQCIAVKRFGPHELIVRNPVGFVDGQWGNLIFTSQELMSEAEDEMRPVLLRSEQALVAVQIADQKQLAAKEAEIQTLLKACEERLALINRLAAMLDATKATPG